MLYVRRISTAEGQKLQAASRRSKDVTRLRRAQILLASVQGLSVPEIARLYHCSEEHVRWLIHEFNERGLAALSRKRAGGRPTTFTEEQGAMIVELALMPPGVIGLPFSRWSLPKLAAAAVQKGIVKSISHEKVRQILSAAGVSYQRTKTWKESNDPDYDAKKNG